MKVEKNRGLLVVFSAVLVTAMVWMAGGCGDNGGGGAKDDGAVVDAGGDASAGDDGGGFCGDGEQDTGEECDEAGETASCDADCTFPVCGDGVVNEAAGEECDGGPGCDDECRITGPENPSGFIDDQTLVVQEGALVGDTVGHAKVYPTVSLDDPSFTLVAGNEEGVFALEPASGEITVQTAGVLDSSTNPTHVLEVEVTDPVQGTDSASIIVEVIPEDEVVYIDPDNSGDSSMDGSRAHPFASFDDFSFEAGHAYLFRRGSNLTYGDSVSVTQDDLLLGAYGSGARPVYHCTADDSNGNVHALVNWNGPQNLTIRDLEIHAPEATSCVRLMGEGGSNATIDNCVAHGSGWGVRAFSLTGLRLVYNTVYDIGEDGMFIQGVSDIEVGYNHIHHINTNWEPPYTPQDQAGGDGVQFSGCNAWHVHHNLIDRTNSGNKFCFISNNPDQDDGVVEHNTLMGPLTDGDGGASIYFHDGTGLVVRYNLILGPTPTALYHHSEGLRFYGNVVWNTSGGVQCHTNSACTVDNNVFHGVPRHVYASGDAVVRNNIFSFADPGDVAIECDGALTESHNLYSEGPGGQDAVVGDPLFVDPLNGDFHLQGGSPAIDAATDVGLTRDKDGNPIPTGAAPDIGAYEYQP